MCLIAFAWQSHPAYRLLLAANRDERHDRPSGYGAAVKSGTLAMLPET